MQERGIIRLAVIWSLRDENHRIDSGRINTHLIQQAADRIFA